MARIASATLSPGTLHEQSQPSPYSSDSTIDRDKGRERWSKSLTTSKLYSPQNPHALIQYNESDAQENEQFEGLSHYRYPYLKNDIDDLADLPPDWDSYGTKPPNSKAIERARHVLKLLFSEDLNPIDVIPSGEEGIGIAFVSGDKYADIEFLNNGNILAATSDDSDAIDVWALSFTDDHLTDTLERIRNHLKA